MSYFKITRIIDYYCAILTTCGQFLAVMREFYEPYLTMMITQLVYSPKRKLTSIAHMIRKQGWRGRGIVIKAFWYLGLLQLIEKYCQAMSRDHHRGWDWLYMPTSAKIHTRKGGAFGSLDSSSSNIRRDRPCAPSQGVWRFRSSCLQTIKLSFREPQLS